MRIDSSQQPQNVANNEQVNRKPGKKAEQAQPAEQEGVKLSAQLKEKLANAPEIRQERVAAIKQAREAGTYKVSDSQLADAMFKEFDRRS